MKTNFRQGQRSTMSKLCFRDGILVGLASLIFGHTGRRRIGNDYPCSLFCKTSMERFLKLPNYLRKVYRLCLGSVAGADLD